VKGTPTSRRGRTLLGDHPEGPKKSPTRGLFVTRIIEAERRVAEGYAHWEMLEGTA
jgi:hypothetical protein